MAGAYRLVVRPAAARDIKALERRPPNPELLPRITAAIRALSVEPRPAGARKLQGNDDHWRIVVAAEYRVLYQVSDAERVVTVLRVADRRDIYRGL